MLAVKHLTVAELEAGLAEIKQAPRDEGVLAMIVRRPAENEREVLQEGELDMEVGLVGDNWIERPSSRMSNGLAHPEMQLNIMNVRVTRLIAQDEARWQLAGDQLLVDLDLSEENLPAGTQLAIGTALVEITPQPHNGCKKFTERFGREAVIFVNSAEGKRLHLRGICAKVVQPGTIRAGDMVRKVS